MALAGVEGLLSSVEESLQCGICYEFLNVAMMTPCSHNYCSLCIRKYMTYKSECPRCFKETAEPQLVNNRTLDEVVCKFRDIRAKLLETLKELDGFVEQTVNSKSSLDVSRSRTIQPLKRTRKMRKVSSRAGANSESPRLNLRSNQRHKEESISVSKTPSLTGPTTSESSSVHVPHNSSCQEDVSDFVDNHCAAGKPPIGQRVLCPVCSVDVPAKSIDHHVEACLTSTEKREALRRMGCKSTTRSHLPKLVYRLLSDKQIRQKLKDQGLSSIGSREVLIKRHQAFKILYNAECDSLHPRPVSEIIRQVQKQEDKMSISQPKVQSVLSFNRKSHLSVIEAEQNKYLTENKSHFDKLIKSVREKHKGSRNTGPKTSSSVAGPNSSSDTEVLESSDSENSLSLLK